MHFIENSCVYYGRQSLPMEMDYQCTEPKLQCLSIAALSGNHLYTWGLAERDICLSPG